MNISEENLIMVAYIFEGANGNVLGEYESHSIEESGLSNASIEDLEDALIEALNKGQSIESTYRNTAYWVLSKRFNHKLIPLFKIWLNAELLRDEPEAVYQILIALDNLEEPVFGKDRNGSYSVENTSLNIRDAKIYLGKNA